MKTNWGFRKIIKKFTISWYLHLFLLLEKKKNLNYKNITAAWFSISIKMFAVFAWDQIKFLLAEEEQIIYIFWPINHYGVYVWTISYIINVSRLTHHIIIEKFKIFLFLLVRKSICWNDSVHKYFRSKWWFWNDLLHKLKLWFLVKLFLKLIS